MDSHFNNLDSARQQFSPPHRQQYQSYDRRQFTAPNSSHQPMHNRNRSPYSSHDPIQNRSESLYSSHQLRENRSRSLSPPYEAFQSRSRSPSQSEQNNFFEDTSWSATESNESSTHFESHQNNSPYESNIESSPRSHHSLQIRSLSPSTAFEPFQNTSRSPFQNSNRSLDYHESVEDPMSCDSLDSLSPQSPHESPCDRSKSSSNNYNYFRTEPPQHTNTKSHATNQPTFRTKKGNKKRKKRILKNSLYKNYKSSLQATNTNESKKICQRQKERLKKALYQAYLKEKEGTAKPKPNKCMKPQSCGSKKLQLQISIVDQSTQQLADWQTCLLQQELEKNLDETLKTCGDNPPIFKGWFFKNNKLEINCSNKMSLDWLTEAISNISTLWEGCNLLIIP